MLSKNIKMIMALIMAISFFALIGVVWAGTLTVSGPGGTTNSGTTNQTAVYTGSTTISSSSVMTDNGTNVGIGSTQPTQKLDIVGTVRATGLTLASTTTTGYVLTATDTAGDAAYQAPSGSSQWSYTASGNIGLGTTSGVGIGTTGTSTGTGLSVMTGNVGIGTWIPNAPLQLIQTGSSNSSGLTLKNGAENAQIYIDGNSLLRLSNANDGSGIVINGGSTGGVAIGVTGIKNRLELSGNAAIGSTYADVYNAPTNGIIVVGNTGIGTYNPSNRLEVIGGNVGIGTGLGGSLITLGGNAAGAGSATVGPVLCLGVSTSGIACLGKCTSISTDTCGCSCL